jgi:hypothetical protein
LNTGLVKVIQPAFLHWFFSVGVVPTGGTTSPSVVLVNVSETPPTVSTVFTLVLFDAEEVWRTRTVSPFTAVPETVVYVPPLREYSPPVTEIVVVASMPVTVIWFDSMSELNATPV